MTQNKQNGAAPESQLSPQKKRPNSILPPKFLRIVALPMTFPAKLAGSFITIPPGMHVTRFEVTASLLFLVICYLLFPTVVPILIFSGIAQCLLLVASEDQDERISGGMGMVVIIIFCVMLSQGVLSLKQPSPEPATSDYTPAESE